MRRPGLASQHLERATLDAAMRTADNRLWCGWGLVYKPDGEASHIVQTAAEVRVHAKFGEHEIPIRCLVACYGVFRFPEVGERVPVLVPGGDLSDERSGPICWVGITDQAMPSGFDARDVALIARAGGKVHLGAYAGTVPIALAPSVEARLQALELAHVHNAPSGGGPTTTPILMSVAYQVQYPTPPSSLAIPNPLHGIPGHVHADPPAPEPTTISSAMSAGSAVAAAAVEGV